MNIQNGGLDCIIVNNQGIVDNVFICENETQAEKLAISLANKYFKDELTKPIEDFYDVESFQSLNKTTGIEIVKSKTSQIPK